MSVTLPVSGGILSAGSSSFLKWLRLATRGRYEDWLFLSLLGSLMGLYSFGIDLFVSSMQRCEYRHTMRKCDVEFTVS